MTLHWWMHWFWITLLPVAVALLLVPLAAGLPRTTPASGWPQDDDYDDGSFVEPLALPLSGPANDLQQSGSDAEGQVTTRQVSSAPPPAPDPTFPSPVSSSHSDDLRSNASDGNGSSTARVSKAIGFAVTTGSDVPGVKPLASSETPAAVASGSSSTVSPQTTELLSEASSTSEDDAQPATEQVSDDETVVTTTESDDLTATTENDVRSFREDDDDAAAQEEESEASAGPALEAAPVSKSRVAPAAQAPGGGPLDAASITGIALGIVVFASLTGAVSFVMYRRRYLNKPQTLNDKCSNPDSSGYIDDSTLRENSEEMYSLDNDSFLNSLEAMTIQNYWTDNVKHTKL